LPPCSARGGSLFLHLDEVFTLGDSSPSSSSSDSGAAQQGMLLTVERQRKKQNEQRARKGGGSRRKKIFRSHQLLSLHNKISGCQLCPSIHIGHIWPQHYYPLIVYFCETRGSGTCIKQGVSSHLAQSAACHDAFNQKYQDLQDIEPTPEFSWDPDDLASEIPAFNAPDVPAQSYHTTVEIPDKDPLLLVIQPSSGCA